MLYLLISTNQFLPLQLNLTRTDLRPRWLNIRNYHNVTMQKVALMANFVSRLLILIHQISFRNHQPKSRPPGTRFFHGTKLRKENQSLNLEHA